MESPTNNQQITHSPSGFLVINNKLSEYISRAEKIKSILNQVSASNNVENDIEKVLDILGEAAEKDKAGNKEQAFDLYTKSIDLFLVIVNIILLNKNASALVE